VDEIENGHTASDALKAPDRDCRPEVHEIQNCQRRAETRLAEDSNGRAESCEAPEAQ
jgi:hypothetical protein